MGSKFLGTSTNDLSSLQDGSFALNVASADVQSLVPSMPVRTSATRALTSGLIGVEDCNFTPLTNPTSVDLDMNNNRIINTYQMSLTQNGDAITPPVGSISIFNNGGLRFVDASNITYAVATTGDLASYLPLAGGTMTGSIDMGGQEIKNCGAFRISTAAMKTVIGSTATSAGSNYSTVVGGLSTVDGSSVSSTIVGYGNTITASTAPTILGVSCTASNNAINSILIGSTNTANNATSAVVIGNNSSSTANSGHIIGPYLTNSTANSLLIDSSANIRSNSTTCDLGTTAKPFQSLYITNVYSNAALNLGTSTTTSVNVGRSGQAVNVNGILVAPLPKAAWYMVSLTSPSFTALTFQNVALPVNTSTGLVDFTIDSLTGNLTYTGTQTRTFSITCNMNLLFFAASTLIVVVNKNSVVGLQNGQTSIFWDVTVLNKLQPLYFTDQIVLNTGDVVMLCARWGNTSASDVAFGHTSFQIAALPN